MKTNKAARRIASHLTMISAAVLTALCLLTNPAQARWGGGGWGGGRGRETSVARPDEDFALFIHRKALGVDEFGFEILQVGVIAAKLPLQGPIRHALPLAQQVHDLIEERVKVHRIPAKQLAKNGNRTGLGPIRGSARVGWKRWAFLSSFMLETICMRTLTRHVPADALST